MAGIGRAVLHLVCARNAGVRGPNGETLGGQYTPPWVNQAGQEISARWESTFFINSPGWTDSQGQAREGRRDTVRLIARSGKNSGGRGMAEAMAKMATPGLELSCDAVINTFQGDVWDNGGAINNPQAQWQRVIRPDGSTIKTKKTSFVIVPGTLVIGNESDKWVQAEILKFQQSGGAQGRPMNWNTNGHPDRQIFLNMVQQRKTAMFQPGSPVFGFSLVVTPKGAQASSAYGTMTQPGMGLPTGTAMGAQPLVNGCTIDQYRAQGVNDDLMLQSPMFQAFWPLINAAKMGQPGAVNPSGPVNPQGFPTNMMGYGASGPGTGNATQPYNAFQAGGGGNI